MQFSVPNPKKFSITLHARMRYIQRILKRFNCLNTCLCNPRCKNCAWREIELEKIARTERLKYDEIMIAQLNEASEDKSWKNDTNYLTTKITDQNFDLNHKHEFWIRDNILFIVVNMEGIRTVVTCIEADKHNRGRLSCRPKYKKKLATI